MARAAGLCQPWPGTRSGNHTYGLGTHIVGRRLLVFNKKEYLETI